MLTVAVLVMATAVVTAAPLLEREAEAYQVPEDKKMKLEGVIVELSGERFLVEGLDGRQVVVVLTPSTEIEEKKKNFFRSAKQYSQDDLVLGLSVQVEGRGDQQGRLRAKEVKFTQDDLEVAEKIASRLQPVEQRLGETNRSLDETRQRLSQTEEQAQRLTDEIEEINEANQRVRDDVRNAQDTAEKALDRANAADQRITSLDNFDVTRTLTVYFDAGSHELSQETLDSLNEFSKALQEETGYLVEVVGYASADGNAAYNRRLSESRANTVRRYLTEEGGVPLRRVISPYGFGENRPVADNSTREGRQQNRRVEVRLLLNKALNPHADKAVDNQAASQTARTGGIQ
ncbi:MAG TPA: OmpA family protein [Acidobacteriota bacterium]|nr:OmpA family protein [Acidobacteriota bacterium]